MSSVYSRVKHLGRIAVRSILALEMRYPKLRIGSASDPGTIYYLTPDWNEPAGGVRAMYRHVDILNTGGVSAAVLHARHGFRCTWFDHHTRVVDTTSVALGRNDVLVVPELWLAMLPGLPRGLRHVVFNQGPHLTFQRDPESVARHCATSPDLLGMLTVSEHGQRMLQYAFPHLDVQRVRLSIDRAMFHPGEAGGGRRVAYMPRRGRADAVLVLALLRGRDALNGWEVSPLDDLSQRETAEELRKSSIFLHFTYQEGFGLPAAEAMACGNLVVGCHGFGGREFFVPAFSRSVASGDVLGFARAVEDVLAREEHESGWCRSLGMAASAHVLAHYSAENEREDVLSYYRKLVTHARDGAPVSSSTRRRPAAPVSRH